MTEDTQVTMIRLNSMFLAFFQRPVSKPAPSHMKVRSPSCTVAPGPLPNAILSVPLCKLLSPEHLKPTFHTCPSGSLGLLAEGHPREAVHTTVLGHVSVHSLGSSWVSHGNELTEQRLRGYTLGNRRKKIILLARKPGGQVSQEAEVTQGQPEGR